jgi:tetratricopeptide (TPR) repeat protein
MMITIKKIFISVLCIIPLIGMPAYAQTAEQNTYARCLNKGAEQMKAGDYSSARDSFQEALRYNDSGYDGHLGLGITYFHSREDQYAERELVRAVELNPRDATPHQFLGELSYRKDDLESAVLHWEKACELNPSDAKLRARLDRIKKELHTEKDFNRDVTSHFLTKYEGREKIETGRIVLRILEDAYGVVGKALSYYPDHEIQVILYTEQQFQEVTDAPGWSGGIYDGKIRIPIGGIEQETPGLRRLLYHEYTHAVVRAITPRCPTWINEGLAQYFEGRDLDSRQRDALKQVAKAGKLPSLSNLEGSFMGLNNNQAAYAYLFSLSSTRYMIDTFGMYRIKSVLDELATGADTNKAINSGITLSYEEFERGWKRSLE